MKQNSFFMFVICSEPLSASSLRQTIQINIFINAHVDRIVGPPHLLKDKHTMITKITLNLTKEIMNNNSTKMNK